jgi:hypothetical protein
MDLVAYALPYIICELLHLARKRDLDPQLRQINPMANQQKSVQPSAQKYSNYGASALNSRFVRAISLGDYKLICPTWQGTYFAAGADFPLNPSGKSKVKSPPSCPARGALAIVTNVGAGCGGRGSVGRERCSQGGSSVSGHSAQTTDA